MTLFPNPFSFILAATGVGLLSAGAQQRRDVVLKVTGLTAIGLALMPTPALADQFVEASDGSTIECELARGELTRIALVEDDFANVSKIASGFPYNDFQVTHEPVRGDIYISVPPQYASGRISFFATSKAGHVYKFACRLTGEEASQLFITNPALVRDDAEEWSSDQSRDDVIVSLIEAMASDGVLPGFSARAELSRPRRTGGIEVQQVAQYDGSDLTGQRFVIRNTGSETINLAGESEAPANALAFAYGRDTLAPGEATSAFLVFVKGGLD